MMLDILDIHYNKDGHSYSYAHINVNTEYTAKKVKNRRQKNRIIFYFIEKNI